MWFQRAIKRQGWQGEAWLRCQETRNLYQKRPVPVLPPRQVIFINYVLLSAMSQMCALNKDKSLSCIVIRLGSVISQCRLRETISLLLVAHDVCMPVSATCLQISIAQAECPNPVPGSDRPHDDAMRCGWSHVLPAASRLLFLAHATVFQVFVHRASRTGAAAMP